MRYDAFLSYSHAADGKLAPALQGALHRFARPWNRLRALRVFRDKTSLAATPELWPAIVTVLGQSGHFLLLASPQAAASKWVQRETEWWVANRPAEKIFVLLTEGCIAWDERTRDFDWARTTALPDTLRGQFQSEPLYVDLAWARQQEQLDLKNTRFRQAILDIAAPLHGKDKDELDGEDVRQFSKTRRLRRSAVAGLIALVLMSTTAAIVAVKQRNIAIAQARIALSRQFAAEAVSKDSRLDVAFLLATSAHRLSATAQARAALQWLLTRVPFIRGVLATEGERALAFSPNDKLLACAAGPKAYMRKQPVVSLWDVDTRQIVARLEPATTKSSAQAVAFTPDGKSLAVGYSDGSILLWDVLSRQPTGPPLPGNYRTQRLIFSVDGRYLFSSSFDGIALWDVARRRLAPFPMPRLSYVGEVDYRRDGKQAAAVTHGIDQTRVVVWDIESGKILHASLSLAGEPVTAFAFHPDGKHWLLGTRLGRVTLYDPVTQQVSDLPIALGGAGVAVLRTSTNGRALVAKGMIKVVVWDLVKERDFNFSAVSDLNRPELVSPADSLDSAFAISPAGMQFAQSMDDGAIVLWDYSQRRQSLGEHFDLEDSDDLGIGFMGRDLSEAQLGARRPGVSTIVLWDAAQRRRSGEDIRSGHEEVTSFEFSPDSQILATGGREGSIVLWDVTTHQPVAEPLQAGEGPVTRLTFSADGKLLASSGGLLPGQGPVTLWDVRRRQVISRPFGREGGWRDLAFSQDGRLLMAAGRDGKIQLYDVAAGKLDAELNDAEALTVVFGAHSRQLLSIRQSSVVTWDIATRRSVEKPMRLPAEPGVSTRLSPDRKILAVVSTDGLRMFDAVTRQPLGDALPGEGAMDLEEGRMGFSPDGQRFVVGGVFSPNGKWLASRAPGSPFVWHIDLESWLGRACDLANRNLTPAEWRRYAADDANYVTACPHLSRATK